MQQLLEDSCMNLGLLHVINEGNGSLKHLE